MYYDVELPGLERVVSGSCAVTIAGNFHNLDMRGKLALTVNEPFNAYVWS